MRKTFLLITLFFVTFPGFANPPPANKVFHLSATVQNPNALLLNWNIKPGFFLYKDRIKLSAPPNTLFDLGTINFPKALVKKDKTGHSYKIYRNQLRLPVPVLAIAPSEAYLRLTFQGCADDGFCYPPETRQFKLLFNHSLALTKIVQEEKFAPIKPPAPEQPESAIERLFSTDNLLLILFSFLGFGLLLSFTPCVLPMVPVLSGLIVGHGKNMTTRKAFFLSFSYVLSMAITYAMAGALVAMMGSNLQIAMQSPWSITLFSILFVLLAFSMFGFYDLRLPLAWQNKLASVTRSQSGGHYLSAALMGCLSTLILSPCVTAPLIGALGYIAQTGDVFFGSMALFSLGIGMGLPLLLIGTSAGKLLPKAGQWMNEVKAFFGFLLLAVAVYLLDRIVPGLVVMGLWGSLLIFAGIYLGALGLSSTRREKFNQALGIICLLYGLLILIGASQGNVNPLLPLASNKAVMEAISNPEVQVVTSLKEVKQAMLQAKDKPVLLDFYADWCTSCKLFAATTFIDPAVQNALKDFLVLKVDVTANNEESRALLKKFNVIAPPTFIFMNKEGKELAHLRAVGDLSAHEFIEKLTAACCNDISS